MAQKQGLMVFNSDGNPILDITDRLTKISGEVDIIPANATDGNAESGTVQCPELANMPFWFIVTNYYLPSSIPEWSRFDYPSIKKNNNADGFFTWKFDGKSNTVKVGIHIIYGVY